MSKVHEKMNDFQYRIKIPLKRNRDFFEILRWRLNLSLSKADSFPPDPLRSTSGLNGNL